MHSHQDFSQQSHARPFWSQSTLSAATGVLTFALILIFPRSFAFLKLTLIAIYIAVTAPIFLQNRRKYLFRPQIVVFYLSVSIIGTTWSIIGLFNNAPIDAISSTLRLYVGWSIAYALLMHALIATGDLKTLHRSIVISAFAIPAINILGIADSYFELNLISANIREALELRVGFHPGYIQVTSHNIGMLFFITPYLLYIFLFCRNSDFRNASSKLALATATLMCLISGRRALWMVIALQPLLIVGVSLATRTPLWKSTTTRIFAFSTILTATLAAAFFSAAPQAVDVLNSAVVHASNAFSQDDERSLQAPYLIDGFLQNPIFGAGFGSYAGYTRSEESPWLYELTYHQLAFNLGLTGLLIIFVLIGSYTYRIVHSARRMKSSSSIYAGFLIGFLSFCIGAYSNPYFGSFDFLLIIALLPLLSYPRKAYD